MMNEGAGADVGPPSTSGRLILRGDSSNVHPRWDAPSWIGAGVRRRWMEVIISSTWSPPTVTSWGSRTRNRPATWADLYPRLKSRAPELITPCIISAHSPPQPQETVPQSVAVMVVHGPVSRCLHKSIKSWFLSLDNGNHVNLFCRWVWIQGTCLWPSIILTELPETGTWWNTEKRLENQVSGSAVRSNRSFWLVLQTCCRNSCRRCRNQIFRFSVDKNSRTGFIGYLLSSEQTSADFKNNVTRTHVWRLKKSIFSCYKRTRGLQDLLPEVLITLLQQCLLKLLQYNLAHWLIGTLREKRHCIFSKNQHCYW